MISPGRGFEGTGALLRLGLRRDRLLLPAWISVLVLMVAGSARATVDLYPTVASRVQAANAINGTPSLVALYGRIYDRTSLGAVSLLKLSVLGTAMVAVLTAMITVRHTRAEEEAGRLELLGATVVGRRAPLTAALAIAALTSATIGVGSAAGLLVVGLPTGGAVGFGAAWAGAGLAYAAAAAVAAQLTTTARNATSLSIGFLGLTYVLRGIGDTSPRLRWLTWISPVGWAHEVRAFAGERWWVLVLLAAFAVTATKSAYVLAGRRDLGAGLLPERPGPVRAGPLLHSALGLAWRLQRGALLTWTAAFAALGVLVGSIATDVGSLLDSPQARDMIRRLGGEKSLTDAFLAAELGVLGLVAAAYGVHAALRLRSEETSLRAEPVLATAVGRWRWAGSHLIVAMAGTTCLSLAAGVTAGGAYAWHTRRAADVLDVLGGALVQLPAIWVVIGIVVAAFGVGARAAGVGWGALVTFLLLGEFGPLFKLPQPVMDLSPFAHVPQLPGTAVRAMPIVALLAAALMLTIAGLDGLRRRDMA